MVRKTIVFAAMALVAIGPAIAIAADGYVTAESRYSVATISAPVRQVGNHRYEVRLPGGSWVDCGRSCSDTLRRETVDFWQTHSGFRDSGEGAGYFLWRR